MSDAEQRAAELEERLVLLRRELAALRKELRRARPVDVPTMTAALHLLEAIAAGELPRADWLAERGYEYALSRGQTSVVLHPVGRGV